MQNNIRSAFRHIPVQNDASDLTEKRGEFNEKGFR